MVVSENQVSANPVISVYFPNLVIFVSIWGPFWDPPICIHIACLLNQRSRTRPLSMLSSTRASTTGAMASAVPGDFTWYVACFENSPLVVVSSGETWGCVTKFGCFAHFEPWFKVFFLLAHCLVAQMFWATRLMNSSENVFVVQTIMALEIC